MTDKIVPSSSLLPPPAFARAAEDPQTRPSAPSRSRSPPPPRRDRSRSRSRSRSPPRRDRGGRRDRDRDRDRDRGRRDRRDRGRDRDRPPRTAEERQQAAHARELARLERDARTVFASGLPTAADERELFQFFSQAGRVADIKLIRDRGAVRSKGVAYIEMGDLAGVAAAVGLTGQLIRNLPVVVKASEAEKNVIWELEKQQKAGKDVPVLDLLLSAQQGGIGAGGTIGTDNNNKQDGGTDQNRAPQSVKIALTNVHTKLGEAEIRAVFENFGAIEEVVMRKDESGRFSGHVFITFTDSAAGQAATSMHGTTLGGQPIVAKVYEFLPRKGAVVEAHEQETLPPPPQAPQPDLDRVATDTLTIDRARQHELLVSRAAASGIVLPSNDYQERGETPNPNSATHPMQYLPGRLGPSSPIPTPCILIKNMFNPAEETGEEWDLDIAEDVRAECAQQYGPVAHLWVDKDSAGFVYVRFVDVGAAEKAHAGLQGRVFGGKKLYVEYSFLATYMSHFQS